ncbi:MAG: hypothetical protein ABFS30_10385 [Pseudomonadota bacterium]
MPLQNRVTPSGEIIADSARGLFMGNRGILHDDARRLGKARWRHRNWITCLLDFKGRRRDVMSPRRYTELFFLDEAVALAAGHRPCAECRHDRYRAFLAAWTAGAGHDGPPPRAHELDATLHAARLDSGTRRQRTFRADLAALPDGIFIRLKDSPFLVLGDRLLRWAPGGYGDAAARPSGGPVCVLTPRPTVAAMTAGYRPELPPGL